ncbi:hypothetical protein F5B22DRAFT_641394 [Xylaria bambusicola]|uniref:uncharacterized protein n=1 Tax=Xylaria bambusicola TaxID=326684 RepID=UPI002007FC48|nr:uncharacterized protein F5B22DRAFT_641394 [Xylaria bambusicola]KAI0526243.1 hypothetical protein F5B22DRAFT_641394 [Xylaria bambusicola]
MRHPLVLAAFSFAVATTAGAQDFASYVPECAPPCVEQTLNTTQACASLDDNECLCTHFQQIIFPTIQCFIQSCNATNPGELRSEITAGWQKFCSDSGSPIDVMSGWGPGPRPSSSMSSSTPSITLAPAPTGSNETVPIAASGLSTGQKAGIGVGAGVGSLAVIGGLVFIGFRLGQKKRKANNDTGNAPASNEETQPDQGQSATLSTDWHTAEGGKDVWTHKSPADPVELPSPPAPQAELPAHEVKELPTTNQPVELWHGVMPPELSADSEIPRTASITRS